MPERKVALAHLLGDRTACVKDYPPAITLPPQIQEGLKEAIEKTEDERERSINFNYDQKLRGWVTSAIKKGTPQHENIFSKRRLLLLRYDVHAHTHSPVPPPGSPAPTSPEAFSFAQQGLPNVRELRSTDIKTIGAVADIIGSSIGNFVIVRNTVTKPDIETSREEERAFYTDRWAKIERLRKEIEKIKQNSTTEDLRTALAHAIAVAFRDIYTCYLNDDPASPQLERIKV